MRLKEALGNVRYRVCSLVKYNIVRIAMFVTMFVRKIMLKALMAFIRLPKSVMSVER